MKEIYKDTNFFKTIRDGEKLYLWLLKNVPTNTEEKVFATVSGEELKRECMTVKSFTNIINYKLSDTHTASTKYNIPVGVLDFPLVSPVSKNISSPIGAFANNPFIEMTGNYKAGQKIVLVFGIKEIKESLTISATVITTGAKTTTQSITIYEDEIFTIYTLPQDCTYISIEFDRAFKKIDNYTLEGGKSFILQGILFDEPYPVDNMDITEFSYTNKRDITSQSRPTSQLDFTIYADNRVQKQKTSTKYSDIDFDNVLFYCEFDEKYRTDMHQLFLTEPPKIDRSKDPAIIKVTAYDMLSTLSYIQAIDGYEDLTGISRSRARAETLANAPCSFYNLPSFNNDIKGLESGRDADDIWRVLDSYGKKTSGLYQEFCQFDGVPYVYNGYIDIRDPIGEDYNAVIRFKEMYDRPAAQKCADLKTVTLNFKTTSVTNELKTLATVQVPDIDNVEYITVNIPMPTLSNVQSLYWGDVRLPYGSYAITNYGDSIKLQIVSAYRGNTIVVKGYEINNGSVSFMYDNSNSGEDCEIVNTALGFAASTIEYYISDDIPQYAKDYIRNVFKITDKYTLNLRGRIDFLDTNTCIVELEKHKLSKCVITENKMTYNGAFKNEVTVFDLKEPVEEILTVQRDGLYVMASGLTVKRG
jgi:hypothetical protein